MQNTLHQVTVTLFFVVTVILFFHPFCFYPPISWTREWMSFTPIKVSKFSGHFIPSNDIRRQWNHHINEHKLHSSLLPIFTTSNNIDTRIGCPCYSYQNSIKNKKIDVVMATTQPPSWLIIFCCSFMSFHYLIKGWLDIVTIAHWLTSLLPLNSIKLRRQPAHPQTRWTSMATYPHNSHLIASLIFLTKCTTSYFTFVPWPKEGQQRINYIFKWCKGIKRWKFRRMCSKIKCFLSPHYLFIFFSLSALPIFAYLYYQDRILLPLFLTIRIGVPINMSHWSTLDPPAERYIPLLMHITLHQITVTSFFSLILFLPTDVMNKRVATFHAHWVSKIEWSLHPIKCH
jgi:hypothetical protein